MSQSPAWVPAPPATPLSHAIHHPSRRCSAPMPAERIVAATSCQPWMPHFGPSVTSVCVRACVCGDAHGHFLQLEKAHAMSRAQDAQARPSWYPGMGGGASGPPLGSFSSMENDLPRSARRCNRGGGTRWQEGRGSPAFNPSRLCLPSGGATGPTPSGVPWVAT